jgi:sigma-B regulation protein RsbU (phosphoserine phosphatase)
VAESHRASVPPGLRLGLLIEALSNRFWHELVLAVSQAARRRGVRLFVFIGGTLDAPEIGARQANRCYQLPSPVSVDGLIVTPLGSLVGPERLAEYFERYRPMPMAALTATIDQLPSICTDNVHSMRQAVSHLIEVHRVRRIAFLRGPRLNGEAELRYQGYCEALSEHGLPFDPELVLQGDFTEQSGARLLSELDLSEGPPFEALVAANDNMALGALGALCARGVRVPERVLVVGFDDLLEGRWGKPSLSTLRQALASLADGAVQCVVEQLAGRPSSPLTLIPGELVLRESCGCRAMFDALSESAELRPEPAVRLDATPLGSERVASAFATLAPPGSEELEEDWKSELSVALASDLEQGRAGRGLERLGGILLRAAQSGRELGDWQRLVAVLRASLTPEERARVEALLYHYRVRIGDAAERQQAALRIRSESLLHETIAAGSDVLGSFSEQGMFDALTRHLAGMSLGGCWISLYEPAPHWPPEQSRLIFAYRDGARVELPPGGVLFQTQRLAPPEHLPEGAQTLSVAPLFFGDTPLGMLLFELGSPQAQVYEWLREQISVALEGARLVRRVDQEIAERERAERRRLAHELELAARIQASVLPQQLAVPGLELAARMLPASEVGGDLFDVLPVSGGAWLSIGDVAGHGLGPGVVMMMLQSSVAAVLRARPDLSPSAAIEVVNTVLFDNVKRRLQQGEHATLLLLRYEANGRILLAGAHEEPLIYRARTGCCESLPTPGLWVGIKPDVRGQLPETESQLEPGDVLLLYTDGVVEARNAAREQYGVERLARELTLVHAAPVEQIRDHLLNSVQSWMDRQRDDITLVVARQGKLAD